MGRVTKKVLEEKLAGVEGKELENKMFLGRLSAHIKMLKAQVEDMEELLREVVTNLISLHHGQGK